MPEAGECRSDRDCSTGVCRRDFDAAHEDGEPLALRCGAPVDALGAGSACDRSEECSRGLCAAAGTCVAPCDASGDCGAGSRCEEVFIRVAADAMQPTWACVARVNAPPDVQVSYERRASALSGAHLDEIALPPAERTTLFVLEPACDVRIEARSLETATVDETVLFAAGVAPPGDVPYPNPIRPAAVPLTILLPNGPNAVLSDAGYTLALESTGASHLDVTVMERDAGAGGTLDIDLFYVGIPGWAPAGERGPPEVAAALETVEAIYASAGITLGEVRQHAIVGSHAARLAVVDFETEGGHVEIPTLFALSRGLRGPALPIFLVRAVELSVGIAGGTPGPQGLAGTPGSGIAVGVDVAGDRLGLVLAHEIGHYMGLFHTTEADGSTVEPLTDTPVCALARDADGDGLLTATECDDEGGRNLMFWSAGGRELTDQQGEVISRSLLLRR